MHVLVCVNRRLRITYLPGSLDAQDRPTENTSLWTGRNFVQKQAQFVQKGFFWSQTRRITQLCVTSCTYAQWLNSDGATAWELNREATGMVGTEQYNIVNIVIAHCTNKGITVIRELNREATGRVGTEQSQGRRWRQFDTAVLQYWSINYTTSNWILPLIVQTNSDHP